MARDRLLVALAHRTSPLAGLDSGVTVCCWDELWQQIRAVSDDDRGPALASAIAIRTVFEEAIRVAIGRGEIGQLATMLELPGFRRQLLARFGGWTLAEIPSDGGPPATSPTDREAWALYGRFRDLLAGLELEDGAGIGVWASKQLVRKRSGYLSRFRQVTFLDFEPSTVSQWRVLEHAVQTMASVQATLPFEPDPERAELYEAVARTRERLLSLGFEESRVGCDLWRPSGLRAAESLLFREAPEEGPPRTASISSPAGLTIRGAPQGDGTARVLAREVREILGRGVDPGEILVLFRQWSPQAELILETLRSWDIPAWSRETGALDGDSAVAALVLAMRIPAEEWDCDLIVRLLRHGQVRPSHPSASPRALVTAASAIKAARVFRGGPDLILRALARAADDPKTKKEHRLRAEASRGVASWILGVLERLDRRRGWSGHLEQLLNLSETLGLGRLPRARHALDQLRDVLEERGEIVDRLRGEEPERPVPWVEFVREVRRIVAETPLDDPGPPASGCVRLATVDEARGARAKHILLADLAEGTFPAREAVEPFLALRPGEAPDAPARLGYSRESLRFLGVLGSAEHGAVLLYPTTGPKGQEILRAGFLDDLLALLPPEAERLCHESDSRFHPALIDRPDLAAAPSERRVLALASSRELGDNSALARLPASAVERRALEGVSAALVAMKGRGYKSPFGPFDGLLRDGMAILDVGDRFNPRFLFSPSQLETYIGCPFQFFAKYVMKLGVRDERDELDEDFTERGSRIHAMLEAVEMHRQSLGQEMDAARIESIALNEVLRVDLADATDVDLGLREIENRRLKRVLNRYRVQLRDYESASPSKPIPHAFELTFGQPANEILEQPAYPPLQIGPEDRGVRLQGMIDRIDVVETPQGTAFRVIDYKSGAGPSASDVKAGHMLQLPLYALAVERHILADRAHVLLDVGYWGLKKDGYRSIRFERWRDDQEALESYVVEVVQKLRDGAFPVNSRQPGCEGFCDYRAICRVRQVRSALKEPGNAIVTAISLSATASRGKDRPARSVPARTPDVPGVVRVDPLSPDADGEESR